MAVGRRFPIYDAVINSSTGLPMAGATVTFYLNGVGTLATVYADKTTATPISGSSVTSDSQGFFAVFVDTKDYALRQGFKYTASKAGVPSFTLDGIFPFKAILPWVSVEDFGAAGDGTADDTSAIQAALDSFGTNVAGAVVIPQNFRCVIDSDLTIPRFVTLRSFSPVLGIDNPNWALVEASGPILYVNPAATINMNSSSRISGIKVLRKGIQWNITSAQVTAQFMGTAITILNHTDDAVVEDCVIAGFLNGISTISAINDFQRLRLTQLMMDNINCVTLENCYDVTYIDKVHCWPLVTVASPLEPGVKNGYRAGSAIKIFGLNDWTKITDCFNFGYQTGYEITGTADHTHLIGCSADHMSAATDTSIGFDINGAWGTVLIGCHAAAKNIACRIAGGALMDTQLIDFNTQAIKATNIACATGRVSIRGGYLYSSIATTVGVDIQAGADIVDIDGMTFEGNSPAIQASSTSKKVYHRNCKFIGVTTFVTNPYAPTIASATSLQPDGNSMFFTVTGTTNITSIANASVYANKQLTLKFAGILTVTDNGTTLNLNGDFVTTANAMLTLVSDGTNWTEVSRSVN